MKEQSFDVFLKVLVACALVAWPMIYVAVATLLRRRRARALLGTALRRFDRTAPCAKCGIEQIEALRSERGYYSDDVIAFYFIEQDGVSLMKRQCSRCRGAWLELPLDAPLALGSGQGELSIVCNKETLP